MPVMKSSGSSPARPPWRSSAAGPTPTPSRAAVSTTPNSMGSTAAREVERLVKSALTPLPAKLDARLRKFDLPLEPPPDRAALERRAKVVGSEGFLAKSLIGRLDRGESLETHVPYSVETWCFGDDLAMVFLPGEVVVDYALRLKWEIDQNRLWVVAYSNDVPCYIPSRRDPERGRLRSRPLDGLLRAPRALRPRNRRPDHPGRPRALARTLRRPAKALTPRSSPRPHQWPAPLASRSRNKPVTSE